MTVAGQTLGGAAAAGRRALARAEVASEQAVLTVGQVAAGTRDAVGAAAAVANETLKRVKEVDQVVRGAAKEAEKVAEKVAEVGQKVGKVREEGIRTRPNRDT